MTIDVEKLTVVAEWLESGAPHVDSNGGVYTFDMEAWNDQTGSHCGSAMCIGGALEQFFGQGADKEVGLGNHMEGNNLADKLFFPWQYSNWEKVETNDPVLAARVIRNLIVTGNVDWGI
tara:strand:+ start:874 stop:1230 length:357 start_codon:yes stop_codon:yes gene_type:complete